MSETPAKYTLDYTPDTNIPDKITDYFIMVMKRDPGKWALWAFVDILHGIRYPLSFFFMGLVIDALTNAPDHSTIPQDAWFYTGMIFLSLFIGEMAHATTHYMTFDWYKTIRAHLRTDMLSYVLGHSSTYFQDNFSGSISRKISEGVNRVPGMNTTLRFELLLPLLTMISSSLVLIKVSWIYSLIVSLFLFSIMLPVFLKLKKIRIKAEKFSDSQAGVMGQLVDSLTNIMTVKSFANEDLEMDAHKRVTETEMKTWHKMIRVFLLLDNYRRISLIGFGAGMMVACIIGWQHQVITLGDIASIMGIAFSFTAAAWNLSFGIIHISEHFGYIQDSLKNLVVDRHVQDAENAKPLRVAKGQIEFRDVDFRYKDKNVFTDLGVTIKPGQSVGLVGLSGAGKTTFINLTQRLFDVTKGGIYIDDQNISDVTQASLRRHIATIPQDTSLFHRSLMENIRYGDLNATDKDVIEAAKRARAHEFIEELPEGYETKVGERGVKLSGGQRQRVAIARAILKDAPILILDEATSALDSESEKLIQESLYEFMKDRTVIAIAHRLSTIAHLDRILVMEDGKIVEDGTHKKLLKEGKTYAKLWSMQSGGFLKE